MNKLRIIILLSMWLPAGALALSSASYESDPNEIDDGGGKASSSNYVLHGSLGKSLVGAASSSGGNFQIHGGVVNAVLSREATVQVTSPNGSESWPDGSVQTITWDAPTSATSEVHIEFSSDGIGGAYTDVAASAPNTGTYSWTVPTGISSDCWIRVSLIGYANINTSDTNDAAFSITDGSTVAPDVTSTSPADLDVIVDATPEIIVTFSLTMDPVTTATAFTFSDGVSAISATGSVAVNTLTITPDAPLTAGSTYTVTITTAATSMAGVPLAVDYSFSFTVSDVAIVSTSPADGDTVLDPSVSIVVTFTGPMNPVTTASAFTISDGVNTISATGSVVADTLTITPDAPLATGNTYTVTITTAATNTVGASLAADTLFSFTIPSVDVVSTSPAYDEVVVDVTAPIIVTFSVPMDPITTATAFTISDGAGVISATGSVTGDTLTITPDAPLAVGGAYTVTITTAATSTAGAPIAADYIFPFTVADVAVLSTIPADAATGVATSATVQVTFSAAMDQTATEGAFSIAPVVSGTFSWNGIGDMLTFTPDAPLTAGSTYTVTITTAATDTAGVPLAADYMFSFTLPGGVGGAVTVVSTSPQDGDVDVDATVQITVTFSTPMDPATTATAFTIDGGVTATGLVTGDTLTITPSANLSDATTYTVTIGTGASSLTGNALAAAFNFTFTTLDFTPPAIVSTVPANGALDVQPSASIVVQFNVRMDALTTETAFTISPAVSASGSVSGNTLTITLDAPLATEGAYTVTITTAATSTAGVALPASPNNSFLFTVRGVSGGWLGQDGGCGACASAISQDAGSSPRLAGTLLPYVLLLLAAWLRLTRATRWKRRRA